jgi:hypothetical protein
MRSKYLRLVFVTSTLMLSAPAFATHTVVLPNGIEVPYFGQSAPLFSSARLPNGQIAYRAFDQAGQATYYYNEIGAWVGASGAGASSLTLPAVPTTITLPNGSVVPYRGQGVPDTSFVDAQGNFYVTDPVSQRSDIYSSLGQPIGGGANSDGGISLSSSSSFGAHASSGIGTTTSGGVGAGDPIATPPSSSGSSQIPAPPAFALFGLGAGILAFRRFRSRKGAQC